VETSERGSRAIDLNNAEILGVKFLVHNGSTISTGDAILGVSSIVLIDLL
jgi:hypothetical protein